MNKLTLQISYCILSLFLVVVCEGGKESKYEVGLRPFPRVGRRENAWNLAKLRDELFAFPRIGRADPQFSVQETKRTGPKPINNGLWFGPRLGRVQKRYTPEGYLLDPTDSFRYAARLLPEPEEESLMDAMPDAEDNS